MESQTCALFNLFNLSGSNGIIIDDMALALCGDHFMHYKCIFGLKVCDSYWSENWTFWKFTFFDLIWNIGCADSSFWWLLVFDLKW